MNQAVLLRGIEIVTFLFAAFGGFLTGMAPPNATEARFAVGIGSFLSLFALLFISAVARRRPSRAQVRRWLAAAVILALGAVGSAWLYKDLFDRLTFAYPPESTTVNQIAGAELTAEAAAYLHANANLTKAQLLARFGGLENKTRVWPEDSLKTAASKLIATYIVFVVTLAGSLFAIIETTAARRRIT
jgi:hypothetical protein